jgi:hypothetical protein
MKMHSALIQVAQFFCRGIRSQKAIHEKQSSMHARVGFEMGLSW